MVFWEGGGKNGVGILVDKDLHELVVEVRRVNDRLLAIKLVVGGFTLNKISAYAPQGLDREVKRHFWEDFDEMVHGIPHTEKFFIGGNFNGHIRATYEGYVDVHGGFGFGDCNDPTSHFESYGPVLPFIDHSVLYSYYVTCRGS
ncbi:uncharacterized protein LOC142164099 [Nicotiana tabacum]|uniref:Uncharacterized protein LOC142164099 n=1 Tax=Nicotiana tabacum TaxID=4097 RepID=A0AC58RXD8_TOBAC